MHTQYILIGSIASPGQIRNCLAPKFLNTLSQISLVYPKSLKLRTCVYTWGILIWWITFHSFFLLFAYAGYPGLPKSYPVFGSLVVCHVVHVLLWTVLLMMTTREATWRWWLITAKICKKTWLHLGLNQVT